MLYRALLRLLRPFLLVAPLALAACTATITPEPSPAATVASPPKPAAMSKFTPYERHGNLVVNGSFERPVIAAGSWVVLSEVPGWVTTQGPGIELQNNVAGTPWEGSQHIELDSHAPTAIEQTLETEPGKVYALRFGYTARPGVADNAIEVRWDGELVSRVQNDGTGLSSTQWADMQVCVRARSAQTVLEFRDASAPDSVGGYIDEVSVIRDARCEKR